MNDSATNPPLLTGNQPVDDRVCSVPNPDTSPPPPVKSTPVAIPPDLKVVRVVAASPPSDVRFSIDIKRYMDALRIRALNTVDRGAGGTG